MACELYLNEAVFKNETKCDITAHLSEWLS